jgi:hypothetical protein
MHLRQHQYWAYSVISPYLNLPSCEPWVSYFICSPLLGVWGMKTLWAHERNVEMDTLVSLSSDWFFDLRIWRVRKTYFHIYILRTQTQKFTSLITQITPLSSIFYPISFLSPLLFNSLSLRNKESTWGMFSKRGRYNMPVVFLLSLKNWSFSGFCLLWNCSLHLSHVWQSSTNTLS